MLTPISTTEPATLDRLIDSLCEARDEYPEAELLESERPLPAAHTAKKPEELLPPAFTKSLRRLIDTFRARHNKESIQQARNEFLKDTALDAPGKLPLKGGESLTFDAPR